MKKLIYSLAAAALLAVPAMADNFDESTGVVNKEGQIAYSWKYWNDIKVNADWAYWPNWEITYNPELTAKPISVAINYSLKKGDANGPEVFGGAANNSGNETNKSTFYAGGFPALEAGQYTMVSTFTIIPAEGAEAQISQFNTTFTAQEPPKPEYEFEFVQTSTTGVNTLTVAYEFKEKNGKEIPEDAVYSVRLGIIGKGDFTADTKTGELSWDNLDPNTTYTVWSNNPSVKIGETTYSTNYPNWDITTQDGVSTNPTAKLTYTVTDGKIGEGKGKFTYSIELENIEETDVTGYHVWLDAEGNVMKGESNTKEGEIIVDVPAGGIKLWVKGQVTYKDGDETKTINTTPNDQEIAFKLVANPDAQVPVISLTCSNPVATSGTTGTLEYTITTDKPELTGVTYKIFAVTEGDKAISEVKSTTDLTGTLDLKDLNEFAVTNIWVKATAYTEDGGESNQAQYPGEAQGWTGLSIDTSSMADPDQPILPSILTLECTNAVATSATTGTLDYVITLAGDNWKDEFFKSFELFVVTNAFGGADVEVARKTITSIDELTGTLELTGLKEGAQNELWAKGKLTLTNDKTSDELVYPGAAQGWNGLSVTTPSGVEGIATDDNTPAEYYNMQGVRVANPDKGLYIVVKGGKAKKVML